MTAKTLNDRLKNFYEDESDPKFEVLCVEGRYALVKDPNCLMIWHSIRGTAVCWKYQDDDKIYDCLYQGGSRLRPSKKMLFLFRGLVSSL